MDKKAVLIRFRPVEIDERVSVVGIASDMESAIRHTDMLNTMYPNTYNIGYFEYTIYDVITSEGTFYEPIGK